MGAMNEFRVLDPEDHRTLSWDPADRAATEQARLVFEGLLRRGYRAFRVGQEGDGTVRTRFEPADKETLLVPPIRGG